MNEKKIEPTEAMVDEAANAISMEEMDTPLHLRSDLARQNLRNGARTALSSALNHPDAPGLFADEDDRPWEPLSKGDPLNVGDEVRQDHGGITRTAVVGRAGRVDGKGDPWTAEGTFIGVLSTGTWYVRRATQELPTNPGAVIIPADGHEYIEATMRGETVRAREATRSGSGGWYAAWRSGEQTSGLASSREITPGTWKVADQ